MLGFESFASMGGLGRGTAAVGAVLGVGECALTVVETVSTASGFSTEAGTVGFEGGEVAVVTFAGVVEAVPGAGEIVAVVGAGRGLAGVAEAVVVATDAAIGQRWP